MTSILEKARQKLAVLAEQHNLHSCAVDVTTRILTPEQAIGTPERKDYPILAGKECMVAATVKNATGQSFTDMPNSFSGTLADVLALELTDNGARAVFVAVLNAVVALVGLETRTVHCKNNEPEDCARELVDTVYSTYKAKKVGLVGLNPALAEALAGAVGCENLFITDLDAANIGQVKFGTTIMDGRTQTGELIEKSDIVIVTGTTFVNNTFDDIYRAARQKNKPVLVFGVSCAGICKLLDIPRFCTHAHSGLV